MTPRTPALFACALCLSHAASAELFFSEYVEGSGNNKALEIFNPGPDAADLSAYQVRMHFNGGSNPGLTVNLSGSLAAGETYVLANAAATPSLLLLADQTGGGGWFNGDDAVALTRGATAVDVIGQIGVDPGTQWGTTSLGTLDQSLRREPAVRQGDTNASDAFDPAAEWARFPRDTFDGLGSHDAMQGGGGAIGACGEPATAIHTAQGEGGVSPLANQRVAVEGVVVGDFQGANGLRGFFVQEEDSDADADPATSEGIFVFDNAAGPDVAPGEVVRVTGTVSEFDAGNAPDSLTQIALPTAVEVCASGASVTPTPVQLPFADAGAAERFEGMAVILPQRLSVTETFSLGRFGEVLLSSGGRLYTPTAVALPGADAAAVQAANDRNQLVLDDGSNRQNPDPVIFPAPQLSAANPLRASDTVQNLAGVLSYGFDAWRLEATGPVAFERANPRREAPARRGSLRVASFNVLNYFNGDGAGGGFPTARGADTPAEFARQRAKIIAAIGGLDADVIGLMELENDGFGPASAIQDLVDGLNAAAPAGTTYAFIDPGVASVGTDAITVGFLYRKERVTPVGAAAVLDAAVDARFDTTRNRPAIAQTFRDLAGGGRFTVAVNHLKSKGSACDDIGDPDTGDGQGNCNRTRTRAAQALADWLATDPTGSGDPDRLIIGDLNSYTREDPIRALEAAGYRNLVATFGGSGAYSYVFDGQAGYLDHALANPSLATQVTGVAEWHLNADEAIALDYNLEFKSPGQQSSFYDAGPFRSSDHDPVVVDLNLVAPAVTVNGDLDGDADVDRLDLGLILQARNQPANGDADPRDLNRDGRITLADAHRLRLLCTRPQCRAD